MGSPLEIDCLHSNPTTLGPRSPHITCTVFPSFASEIQAHVSGSPFLRLSLEKPHRAEVHQTHSPTCGPASLSPTVLGGGVPPAPVPAEAIDHGETAEGPVSLLPAACFHETRCLIYPGHPCLNGWASVPDSLLRGKGSPARCLQTLPCTFSCPISPEHPHSCHNQHCPLPQAPQNQLRPHDKSVNLSHPQTPIARGL